MEGDRNVEIGRNAVGNVILTGDIHLGHIQPNESPIADYRYQFHEYVENFTGREEVFAALKEFGHAYPCGYFAIIGETGLGKTVLAAEIARRYQAHSFFTSIRDNRVTAAQCLKHLCADLILSLELPYVRLPARAGTDSGFLSDLLEEAVRLRRSPVTVVIDALDEAEEIPGRNPLLLPAHLPSGVFIVLTYRPDSVVLETDRRTPSGAFRLASESTMQRRDTEHFLRSELNRPGLSHWVDRTTYTRSALADILADAAEGNFLYLTYALKDIEEGQVDRDAFNPSFLPRGLQAYYERAWKLIAPSDTTIVELLCAACEPVSWEWLSALSGFSIPVLQSARDKWRRFIAIDTQGLWRIGHKAFADFAARKVDLVAAHRKIGAWFNQPNRWHWQHPYASRHLSTHLEHDPPALFELVRNRRWSEVQDSNDITGLAYLKDVRRAQRLAERLDAQAAEADIPLPYLPEEAWCAIRLSVVGNIVPRFILDNIRYFFPSDMMSLDTALDLFEHGGGRLESTLEALWGILKVHTLTASAFDRLLRFIGNLEDENVRWQAFRDVVRYAPSDRVAEVFDVTRSITNPRFTASLLYHLIEDSKKPWLADAQRAVLDRIAAIECLHCQSWLRSRAAPYLAAHLRQDALVELLAQARSLPSKLYSAWTLGQVAAAIEGPQRERIICEAFYVAATVANPDLQLRLWVEIMAAVGAREPLDGADLALFLTLARDLGCLHCRAVLLSAISAYTVPGQRQAIVSETEALLPQITDLAARQKAASSVAHYLPRSRRSVLPPPVLPDPGSDEQFRKEMLTIIRQSISNAKTARDRSGAFLDLAAWTQEPEKSEALFAARRAALEAVRAAHPAAIEQKPARERLRVRPETGERVSFHTEQYYDDFPGEGISTIRAMMKTPFPMPYGLREADLLGHGKFPWAVLGISVAVGNTAAANEQRLSYVKHLCERYGNLPESDRSEILELARSLADQISLPDSSILAAAFLARAQLDPGLAETVAKKARSIAFLPYRVEALLVLYPVVEQHRKTGVLKDAFSAALRSHKDWAARYLAQIAAPLSRLPGRELYPLWQEIVLRLGYVEDSDEEDSEPFGGLLPILFPILAALAGEQAANETLDAADAAFLGKPAASCMAELRHFGPWPPRTRDNP